MPKQPAALTGKHRNNQAWRNKADAFAAFTLCTYREWDTETGVPGFSLSAEELER